MVRDMLRECRAALIAAAGVGILATFPIGTGARANLLVNGSFEAPVVPSSSFCGPYANCEGFVPGDNIGGWWAVGKGGVAATVMVTNGSYTEPDNTFGTTLHFTPADGNQAVDLTGEGNQGTTNGIKQTVLTIPGTVYQLSFMVGHQYSKADGYAGPSSVALWIDFTGGGSALQGFYSNNTDTVDDISWQQYFYTFEAISGSTTIAFLNATPVGNNYAGLDDVSLVAVPEPAAAAALMTGGLLGALLLRRRQPATVPASR